MAEKRKKTTIMNDFVKKANEIFARAVREYHETDHVDAVMQNPYEEGSIEARLYHKCWIDAVQWHLEDIIRDPNIDPTEALALKRRIDRSNQERTDRVEDIDTYFWNHYHEVEPQAGACINTESPAWAVDRLSILHLKLWHVQEQLDRTDADEAHIAKCQQKMSVLQAQYEDMTTSIGQLLEDYACGRRIMRVYRQMKLYNDPSTNPVLYKRNDNRL